MITDPTIIIGYAMFLATPNANIRYTALFLCASTAFTLGAMCNALVSANVISDLSRNIAIGTNAMFSYAGDLIATWTYLPGDAPRYAIGNSINLACAISWTTLFVATLPWMKYDNKMRDEREVAAREGVSGLSRQKVQGLAWKNPEWR